MSKARVAAGLCATCKYDPDCIYEATPDGVILQCEQFETGFPPEAPRRTADPNGAMSSKAHAANGYPGLCSNCEHSPSCTYPKPEGGVWRCEEYV
jgi:hypothetical protein